jgi:beta-lactamase regulating signal transducer with metallopeptidase domain
MNSELFWIYPFNIIVNSVLSFYTSIGLLAFFIYLLRIKQPRIKSFCYLLPFCKIGLDLFFYRFSNWALAFDLNPLLAQIGTRTLSIQVNPFIGIQLNMQNGQTFSLADVIALNVGPLWIRIIVITAMAGSIITFAFCLIRLIRDIAHTNRIVQDATPIHRSILNPHLESWVNKKKVKYLASSTIHSPCIARKTLLFPSNLIDDLSQHEFEAIIAHEMAHLRWKDCILRLMCWLISAIFWWIPTQWWRKSMKNLQEKASDLAIHQFEISKFDLAAAVLKVARNTQPPFLKPAISFVERKTFLINRMQMILQHEPTSRALGWRTIQYGLLGICLCSILFGKMWIF